MLTVLWHSPVVDCAVCGNPSALEPLCAFHRRILSTAPDLTPEQIRSRCAAATPAVGLVDMFGITHPLPPRIRVGRDLDACDLSILHASISAAHAELAIAERALTIRDLGSLNGTFAGGERVTSATVPVAEVVLRFGTVSFMLCPDALTRGAVPSARRTVPSGDRPGPLVALVRGERWQLTTLADSARFASDLATVDLSLMEGRLLQSLLVRSADAGFLSSAELVVILGFGARAADGDNVRELVRRLRRKLQRVALADLVESQRILGYRLAPWVALAE